MHWTVKYLSVLMAEQEMSTRELEKRAGLGVNTIRRWRQMKYKLPNIDKLDQTLNVLGHRISICELRPSPFTAVPNGSKSPDQSSEKQQMASSLNASEAFAGSPSTIE